MGKKRMWNIVKDFEATGQEILEQKLSRDRKGDQEKLERSGLPTWKELIVDAQEFLSGKGEGKDFIVKNSETKFFIAFV